MLHAGSHSIPDDIVAVARADGTSGWLLFAQITLPVMYWTAAVVIMTRFMQISSRFDIVDAIRRAAETEQSVDVQG